MAHGTPDQVAAHWASQMGSATTKITQGVDAVKTAPGQAAAANRAGYIQGVQRSVDKWAANVAKVTLPQWQAAMKDKGIVRIGDGASKATPKMTSFFNQLLPYIDGNRPAIKAMPNATPADAKNRMNAWFDVMSSFKKQ